MHEKYGFTWELVSSQHHAWKCDTFVTYFRNERHDNVQSANRSNAFVVIFVMQGTWICAKHSKSFVALEMIGFQLDLVAIVNYKILPTSFWIKWSIIHNHLLYIPFISIALGYYWIHQTTTLLYRDIQLLLYNLPTHIKDVLKRFTFMFFF